MKSSMNLLLTILLLAVSAVHSTSAFAAKRPGAACDGILTTPIAPPKEAACNQYFQDVMAGQPADVRLTSGLIALDASFELGFDVVQMSQLRAYFDKLIAQDPDKQVQIEKAVYFGCTTDLTPEDKTMMRDEIRKQTGI